jgi:hypothetical protein
MNKGISAALVAFATMGAVFATSVAAAPITYRLTVPNASGANNGTPFASQTVAITVRADTALVAPVASIAGSPFPGNCVPASSTSIAVGGGAPFQATAPVFFCSTPDAFIAGIFTTPDAQGSTWYFVADYSNAGITNFALASNFPSTSNVPNDTASTTSPLNLAGGGVASIDVVPPSGTTFSASLGGGASATVVKPVPTLNDLALMLLSALLAAAGMLAHARRKRA